MARKPAFTLVPPLAETPEPPKPIKMENRDALIAQYGPYAIAAAEAALNDPKSDESLALYLRLFPGDLDRALRLADSMNFMISMYIERVEMLKEPDKSQMISALSPFLPSMPKRRLASHPEKAPKLWAAREPTSKTNPAQFTRDVYGQWLGRGMSRKALRDLDEKLYHALSVWEHRHPEDTIKELPTLAEVIDQKIASLAAEFGPDELRKLGTTLQTRSRRAKKV